MTSFLHLFNCFFLIFALFLSYSARFGFAFEDLFAVFVQFQSGHNHLAGVSAHTWAVVPLAFSRCTVQSRRRVSSWKPGLLCQCAALCCALVQPQLHHPFRWAWMERCTSVLAL